MADPRTLGADRELINRIADEILAEFHERLTHELWLSWKRGAVHTSRRSKAAAAGATAEAGEANVART
jgi:hypothetical protein